MRAASRALVVAIAALGVSGVAASGASAAPRYVSTTPAPGASDCTNPSLPCSLTDALSEADPNDTISLGDGTHTMPDVLPAMPLRWAPTDPNTRPILGSPTSTFHTMDLASAQSGTIVEGLEISSDQDAHAVQIGMSTQVTIRDTVIDSDNACVNAPAAGTVLIEDSDLISPANQTCVIAGQNVTVRNSIVDRKVGLVLLPPDPSVMTEGVVEDSTVLGGLQLTAPGAVARRVDAAGFVAISGQGLVVDSLAVSPGATEGIAISSNAPQGTLRAINVTAIAPEGTALHARHACADPGPAVPSILRVSNAIARGATDVQAAFGACSIGADLAPGEVEIDHSNFVTRLPAAPPPPNVDPITVGAGNQSGDPLFVNPANPLTGDFRLRAGSPAIDAGALYAEALPTDLDGIPRNQGPAPDIGAYEFPVPPPGGGPGTTTPPHDKIAPILGRVRLAKKRFRTSTTLQTTVSENARLTVTVQRPRPGKRRRGRCVKPTRKLRKAKRCTRWVSLKPSIQRQVAAGAVKFTFFARVGKKKLRPGRYRLVVVATDAAGNRSKEQRVGFRILAKKKAKKKR